MTVVLEGDSGFFAEQPGNDEMQILRLTTPEPTPKR
jgi:hypothetical protein